MCHVFHGSENSLYIDSEMLIETFVFGRDKSIDDYRRDLFIFDGCTVFSEIFSDQFAVCAVNLGCNVLLRMVDACQSGRLSEQPKKINIYQKQVENE